MQALAGGQIVPAIEPRNMSTFQKKVLLNKEVLAIFKDTSGFDSIAMIADGTPTPATTGAGAGAGAGAPSSSACSVSYIGSSKGEPNVCVKGKSYGCNNAASAGGFATVWASNDCHGIFKCNAVPSVMCESWSHKNVSCPCVLSQVWARPVDNGSAAAVALYNPSEATQDITVHFSAVPNVAWPSPASLEARRGFEADEEGQRDRVGKENSISSSGTSKTLAVRDLWKHTDLGKFANSYTAKAVEPHGVVVIKLTSL